MNATCRLIFALVAGWCVLAAPPAVRGATVIDPTVEVRQGALVGYAKGGIYVFKGIGDELRVEADVLADEIALFERISAARWEE